MKSPADIARYIEEHPRLPPGDCERVSGYGVMGLPFGSGHILGLRRWTASSVGRPFTSIWHRDPAGRWTFYETVDGDTGCTRFFGSGVDRVVVRPVAVEWTAPQQLRVFTLGDDAVDWTLEVGSTPVTRAMSAVGPMLPVRAWRSPWMLRAMGGLAGPLLRAGRVSLTGLTANGQPFDANPLRIWRVTASHATVGGRDLGPIGPLAELASLGDFCIPQVGIFAVGRVFVTPIGRAPKQRMLLW